MNRENINLLNDKGLTPLHLAVLARDKTIVKMLMAFGAKTGLKVGAMEIKSYINLELNLRMLEMARLHYILPQRVGVQELLTFSPITEQVLDKQAMMWLSLQDLLERPGGDQGTY